MNKFTKTQINVMALLAVVIILAVGGVFLLKFPRVDEPVAGGAVEHSKYREARTSLSPFFSREINIGGSGDEKLTAVYTVGEKLFIFGTTLSSDYDFEGGGGCFLAVLTALGETTAFFVYGEEGDTLVCAELCEGGFLCGVDLARGGSALIKINLSGEAVQYIDTSGLSGEKIVDIKVYDNLIAAVTSVTDSADTTNLKARVYDFALNLKAERSFTHPCSLEYIDMWETADGYVIAVNLCSPILNRLAFIAWGLTSQGLLFDIDLGSSDGYRCEAVMPYSGGYLAVIIEQNKVCDVITVTPALALHSRIYLKQSSVTNAGLFYLPDTGYLCLLKRGENLSSMLVLDDTLAYGGVIPEFSAVRDVSDIYIRKTSALLSGTVKGGVKCVSLSNGKAVRDVSFGAENTENVKAAFVGGRYVTVCEVAGKSSDCPENFGGKDIWVAVLSES